MRLVSCLVAALAASLAAPLAARADVLIDDFEDVSDWSGLDPEVTTVHRGAGAGRWDDHVAQGSIRKTLAAPLDASGASHLQLWLHSAVANGAAIEVVLDSDNPADPEGWDYYSTTLRVDWAGPPYLRFGL